jgi:K+ transporter
MLVICGVEAMFVDLGHYTKGAIRTSWSLFVFPALILQYMGQASVLINNVNAYSDPFFLAVPRYNHHSDPQFNQMANLWTCCPCISHCLSITYLWMFCSY